MGKESTIDGLYPTSSVGVGSQEYSAKVAGLLYPGDNVQKLFI